MPKRLHYASVFFVIAALPFLANTATAAQLPATEVRRQLTQSENNEIASTSTTNVVRNLSPDTIDLAEKLNLLPKLVQLEELRQSAQSDSQMLKLAMLKQEIFYELMDYQYDVHISMNKIETEVDKANDKYALLAERRDRAIRLNTYANLVSGGLTGIISGSLNLGQVNYIAPNTIDTIEGVIQTGLSAWGLHELRGDRKIEGGVPNVLSAMTDRSGKVRQLFPHSVWLYLNQVPNGSIKGDTRVDLLVNNWMERGFGSAPVKHKSKQEERMSTAAGTHINPRRITVHVLEDRMAMLTDLQTVVAEMETNLQEILQFVRGTRSLAQNTR